MTVLVPGFVSSDHSCSDSEDDALVTQPLEWRSEKFHNSFTSWMHALMKESLHKLGSKRKRESLPIIRHLVLLLRESSLPGLFMGTL